MAVVQKSKHIAVYCKPKEFKSKQELCWVEIKLSWVQGSKHREMLTNQINQNQALDIIHYQTPVSNVDPIQYFSSWNTQMTSILCFQFVALRVNNT